MLVSSEHLPPKAVPLQSIHSCLEEDQLGRVFLKELWDAVIQQAKNFSIPSLIRQGYIIGGLCASLPRVVSVSCVEGLVDLYLPSLVSMTVSFLRLQHAFRYHCFRRSVIRCEAYHGRRRLSPWHLC